MSTIRKVAIVTGAGSGIGRAVALALHGAGYSVAIAGRRVTELKKTAGLIDNGAGPERPSLVREPGAGPAATGSVAPFLNSGAMLIVPADVSKPEEVRALFARVKDAFGHLDLLFNNAGMGAPNVPMEDLTFEQWSAVVGVNLTGAFLCAQEAIRIMKTQVPRGGRIINNGSISASAPRPNSAPYTATKHAITGLTKSISLDGRKHDIACGQIDIGNAATDLTERMAAGIEQASGAIAPEPRMDLKHVADAVLYMAGLPLEANVQFMTLMATKMPFVGRG